VPAAAGPSGSPVRRPPRRLTRQIGERLRSRPIVDRADAAGKSAAYVERMHKVEASASFFGAEKGVIAGKVAGKRLV